MLRNRQHDSASRRDGLKHLLKNRSIVFDMFQDIKGPDDVKLVREGYPASIHLEQRHPGEALAGKREPIAEDLAPMQPQFRKLPPNPGQDEPCPAANLQKRLHRGEVPSQGPADQPIP